MMFHRTCLESNDFAVGDGRTSTAADHPQDIFLGEFVDVFWEFNMEKSHGKTKESRLINPGTQIISNNFPQSMSLLSPVTTISYVGFLSLTVGFQHHRFCSS